MNKFRKIIIIFLITIVIFFIAYAQVLPIKISHPEKDFKPIEINEANSNIDNNMTLSFLYNMTKEIHPTGSEANYRVKEYIEQCLQEMNVNYEIQSRKLDESFFEQKKMEYIHNIEEIKSNMFVEFEKNYENVNETIQEVYGYHSFDEYFSKEYMNGNTIEMEAQKHYQSKLDEYNGQTLNNIFIKINKNVDSNNQNILLVSHYDSDIESYGAADAGIAVSSLLEVIRCNKDKNFKNNIYVLITDGEENNYWGATEFIENTKIKFDLVINFDNSGNSGPAVLYHYSDDNAVKQYFKSVQNENSYSFTNDIIFKYLEGNVSDAFKFIEHGYNTLDFALIGNPQYYHSNNDTFENIDVNSLRKLTKTINKMVEYYGNNYVESVSSSKYLHFKILNGVEFSINQTAYIVISVLAIMLNSMFTIMLFRNKEKIWIRMLAISFIVLSIIVLVMFKCFSILISLPILIYFITKLINNKKIKSISRIILYEFYFLVVLQPIIMISQYIVWLLIRP